MAQLTAIKTSINELSDGVWIERGGADPSVIRLEDGTEVARVQIVGIIVNMTEASPPQLVIDDGSGTISARLFEKVPGVSAVKVGSLVRMAARPRKYGNGIFLVPEFVRSLDNPHWLEVHRLEIKLRVGFLRASEVQAVPDRHADARFIEEEVIISTPETGIISAIRKLDSGSGAEAQDVLEMVKCSEADLQRLLARGEIFQVSPGFLKVLE